MDRVEFCCLGDNYDDQWVHSLDVVCDCKEMGHYEQIERIEIWDLLCVSVCVLVVLDPPFKNYVTSFDLWDSCSNQRYNHFSAFEDWKWLTVTIAFVFLFISLIIWRQGSASIMSPILISSYQYQFGFYIFTLNIYVFLMKNTKFLIGYKIAECLNVMSSWQSSCFQKGLLNAKKSSSLSFIFFLKLYYIFSVLLT